MTNKGWGKIDFNWAEGARAVFYGCRAGAEELGENGNKIRNSFTQRISSNENMKDVNVVGQTKRTWPSPYPDVRVSTESTMDGKHSVPTYFVGSRKDPVVRFSAGLLGLPSYGYPMAVYRNGQFMGLRHQPGKRYVKQ